MSNKIQIVLSLLLVALFLFAGLNKVSPVMNKDLYLQMVKNFKTYFALYSKHPLGRRVIMFIEKQGIHLTPEKLRHFVGVTELVTSAILVTGPEFLRAAANFILIGVMVGAV